MKIVNLDAYATNPGDLSWDWLEKYGSAVIYERTAASEVVERAHDADVIFVNKTVLDAKTLKQLPNLKYIGLQSTGYNVVDTAQAAKQNIVVTNIPEYSTGAVAQMTFSLILELTNSVALHSEAVHSGEWCECKDFCFWKKPLIELTGKTIGLVGYGKIAKNVASIAMAFGMKVIAFSPSLKQGVVSEQLEFRSIDYLLANADIVSLHCPLNESTENLIDEKALDLMKNTAFLINTARGAVVNEQALANALNSGTIAGAGLDVLVKEPCDKENPLLLAKNCFITPHIAWAAHETRSRLMSILESNFAAFLAGNAQNVVN